MNCGSWLLTLGSCARVCGNRTATAVILLGATLLMTSGCTSRGMTITSEPPGAEVSINRRVVGETPIRVAFTHYGTYRFELRKDGLQTLVKEETVNPPLYGYDPVTVLADNALPARLNDDIYFHYVMKPLEEGEKAAEADTDTKDGDDKGDRPVKSAYVDPKVIEARMQREKLAKDSLMARAVAARGGDVTHPKTHESMQVAIGAEVSKEKKKPADTDQPVSIADTYSVIGPDLAPNLALPSELGPVARIQAAAPQGPTLAQQLGIEAEKPTASNDKPVADFNTPEPKKAAPILVRTPRDEELIYDKPEVVDPATKKKK